MGLLKANSRKSVRRDEDAEAYEKTVRPSDPIWVLLLMWLSAIMAGLYGLERYSFTPGRPAQAPMRWPVESGLRVASGQPTLIIFNHPKCPCTRATMGELASVMAQSQGRVTAYAVFYRPDFFGPKGLQKETWQNTALWESASRIPSVTPYLDVGGVECARFRSFTSGQTLLYDREGELTFSGGITESRGHSGDNDGRRALVSAIDRQATALRTFPVFGCGLCGASPNLASDRKETWRCRTEPQRP